VNHPADRNLEVALSGGGFRAAAFGLGVLIYLAQSGLNKRTATISSVSGGSITNGYVASRCDFGDVAEEDFWPIAAVSSPSPADPGAEAEHRSRVLHH